MITREAQTRERILLSALALFAERGIAATSLNEVGQRAGVTRVTVYRHFADKEELVCEAFLRTEQVFQKGLTELRRNPHADWEKVLYDIGEGLSALPSRDAFARAEELKRLYPRSYAAVQEVRVATLNGMFEQLFVRGKRKGLLRPGTNRKLFQAVFSELTINIFDNPRFRSLGLTDAELYHGITDILLHGILHGILKSE
jgi:AcrR family transcriptional regulator